MSDLFGRGKAAERRREHAAALLVERDELLAPLRAARQFTLAKIVEAAYAYERTVLFDMRSTSAKRKLAMARRNYETALRGFLLRHHWTAERLADREWGMYGWQDLEHAAWLFDERIPHQQRGCRYCAHPSREVSDPMRYVAQRLRARPSDPEVARRVEEARANA